MGIQWREEIEEGDEDLLDWLSEGDIEEDKAVDVPLNDKFPTTLIVINIPKVTEAKYGKLMGVIDKLFDKVGPSVKSMPLVNGETEGYMIITYEQREAAEKARSSY